jgi:hypothetical protein
MQREEAGEEEDDEEIFYMIGFCNGEDPTFL